ncbi:ankyrin repeat-containing domain protein [Xylariaceae sp. FL0662B]|nr:ankyrin repeat-containing domain protein [Xylariaceae sp. FL0662B]
MAQLEDLPNELILMIARSSTSWEDIAALSAVNKHFRDLVGKLLFTLLTRLGFGPLCLHWAVQEGQATIVKELLSFAVNPNEGFEPPKCLNPDDNSRRILYRKADGEYVTAGDIILQTHFGIAGTATRSESASDNPFIDACNMSRNDPLRLPSPTCQSSLCQAQPSLGCPGMLDVHRHHCWAGGRPLPLIHLAAQNGSVEIIYLLAGNGVGLDSSYDRCDNCEWRPTSLMSPIAPKPLLTALHYAICYGQTSAAMLLMESGLTRVEQGVPVVAYYPHYAGGLLSPKFPTGPLHLAALRGNVELIEKLVLARLAGDIQEPDRYGLTPLAYASYAGHLGLAGKCLLQHGADPNAASFKGDCSLLVGACLTQNFEEALMLLDFGASVGARRACDVTRLRATALHACCISKHSFSEADVDSARNVCEHWRQKVVERLLGLDAALDIRADRTLPRIPFRATPLVLAAQSNLINIVKLLLAAGADVDFWDDSQDTPLTKAIRTLRGKALVDMVSCLLDYGCNVNCTNHSGDTPLHLLASAMLPGYDPQQTTTQHELTVVKKLLDHGADIHARRGDRSVFQAFCGRGALEISKFLLARGAKASMRPQDPSQALLLLLTSRPTPEVPSREEFLEITEFLLGIDEAGVMLSNPEVLETAVEQKYEGVAIHLLERGRAIALKTTGPLLPAIPMSLQPGQDARSSLLGTIIHHKMADLLETLLAQRGSFSPGLTVAEAPWLHTACDGSKEPPSPQVLDVLLRHRVPYGTRAWGGHGPVTPLQLLLLSYPTLTCCGTRRCASTRLFQDQLTCHCSSVLLQCIVVLLSRGALAPQDYEAPEAAAVIADNRPLVLAALRDAVARRVPPLPQTYRMMMQPEGHCLNYIGRKFGISEAELRNPTPLPARSFFDTVL